MQTKQYATLNTIRFFCFLIVFLMHCNVLTGVISIDTILLKAYPRFHLGVAYFFMLSAFLLTNLALKEIAIKKFSFKNFFIRRGLRIYPLYFLFIFLIYSLLPIITSALHISSFKNLPNIWYYLTFTNNYKTEGAPFMLDFLWSIAVEEQFYIIFGTLVLLLQKRIIIIPLLLLTIYFIFKFSFSAYTPTHLINNFPYFSFGIFGALFWQKNKTTLLQFLNKKSKIILPLLFLATIYFSFYAFYLYEYNFYNTYVEPFVISILFVSTLLVAIVSENKKNIILNFLGKITYGLYVWHGFVLTICYKVLEAYLPKDNPLNLLFIINFSATLLIATISYHFYEKYFLQLKNKFR